MKVLIIVLSFLLAGVSGSLAQSSDKYGGDKDQCLRNYSLYKGYLKNDNYTDAKMFWQKMVEICPLYSTGVWADGEKIFKNQIEETSDPVKRNQLMDSLVWTYDRRIEYFGDDPRFPAGYILGKKGLALLKYDEQNQALAYEVLKESVKLLGDDSNAAVILTLMKGAKSQFSSGLIDAQELIDNYTTCMNIAEANLRKTPGDEDFSKAKTGIEQYLVSSGAADCQTLIDIFSVQFDDNLKDSEWLNKICDLLKSTGCSETELYTKSSEALFSLEPTAEDAHKIANLYYTNGDFEKAVYYLRQGVEIGDNSEEKASMYYELAFIYYSQLKDYQNARLFAKKASELRPNWGDPYILVGKMYIDARQSISNTPFEQEAVFWAAVDKFIMAKKVDPEQSQKANELINQYSQYFPINEDVFMWTLKDGKSYKVGGWINEETTVRSRKN